MSLPAGSRRRVRCPRRGRERKGKKAAVKKANTTISKAKSRSKKLIKQAKRRSKKLLKDTKERAKRVGPKGRDLVHPTS